MTLEERIEELERITGAITEVHNTKMDLDAHNIQNPSAVVIESQMPTSANNYTWYRKYSDGWVEQGGYINTGSDASYTVSLLIAMENTNYVIFVSRVSESSYTGNVNAMWANTYNKTTTSFGTWGKYGNYPTIHWQVSGKYAI